MSRTFAVQDDLTDLKAALTDRAADLARHLLGEPNMAMSRGRRELRYGRRGALVIATDGPKAGLYYNHELGEGGDLFTLIMREQGLDFRGALHFARDFCGHQPTPPPQPKPKPEKLAANDDPEARLRLARALWARRHPIAGTPAQRYLREARGLTCAIAATLAYLPARPSHGHALIAAFGIADEPEPGLLHMPDEGVKGVHLIRLNEDGGDRLRVGNAKISLGPSLGSPLVVAPCAECNDALAIAEGIENTLAAHEALGIGAWAAGGASRLPALADAVPASVDAIAIVADDDDAGHRHAVTLARRLQERGFEVRVILLPSEGRRDEEEPRRERRASPARRGRFARADRPREAL